MGPLVLVCRSLPSIRDDVPSPGAGASGTMLRPWHDPPGLPFSREVSGALGGTVLRQTSACSGFSQSHNLQRHWTPMHIFRIIARKKQNKLPQSSTVLGTPRTQVPLCSFSLSFTAMSYQLVLKPALTRLWGFTKSTVPHKNRFFIGARSPSCYTSSAAPAYLSYLLPSRCSLIDEAGGRVSSCTLGLLC